MQICRARNILVVKNSYSSKIHILLFALSFTYYCSIMIIVNMQHQHSRFGRANVAVVLFTATIVSLSFVSVAESILRLPEFAEPIKNVTLPMGSDVELSCDVRHLGTYRVTWSWKNNAEQKFLAIGTVKISRNQRVHISRIQKSDDVTQFNLYVYNVKREDKGTYYCSVNSNPMIEQYGTLDVTGDDITDNAQNHYNSDSVQIFNGQGTLPFIKAYSSSTNNSYDYAMRNSTVDEDTAQISSQNNSRTNSSSLSISQNEDSNVFCIDLGEIWESARERLSQFLSALMKFTYSYWFS